MITLDQEYIKKLSAEVAKLPEGKTDTERRLAATLVCILTGPSYQALWHLERLNANNQIDTDNDNR